MEKTSTNWVKLEDVMALSGEKTGYNLLDENNGCVNGCRCGVSIYKRKEYDLSHVGVHDDQEGFFVIEGSGRAMIGEEEIVMEPGTCFIVPAGVPHAMKSDENSEYCKVFWFHAAI